MQSSSATLHNAYRHCKEVTAHHAKTFYFASFFLNRRKRNACYALYAFCRYVDDIIDERYAKEQPHSSSQNLELTTDLINQWRNKLDRVYSEEDVEDPVMVAWADVLTQYHIPRDLPEQLIEGCLMDMQPAVRFEDFEQLYDYCYKVASVVGLMTTYIFGYSNERAFEHAVELGVAMQLTNILRDIGEDAEQNRIYLPRKELKEFGVSEEEILEKKFSVQFGRLMQFQIARARSYYKKANLGIELLDSDSRMTVRLMSYNYSRILNAIEHNQFDVFTQRARVSLPKKILSLPRLALNRKLV